MDLLAEIRNLFAETKRNQAIAITSIDNNVPAWVLRYDDWYGVGIPMNSDIKILERFSNVKMWSNPMMIGQKETTLLLLTSTIESLRYEFASVCAQFVDPGKEGLERRKLINNPTEWWNRWKTLLGNAVQEKTTYSILGELFTYEKLLKEGHAATWSALKQATHDLETQESSYEVKSTVSRYGASVIMNSQFQLQSTGKDLNLVFCRFEQSDMGNSIADMVDRLAALGVERELLNYGLEKMGLEDGSSARNEKYKLLEMRKYRVDDTFPSISASSFVNNKIPEAVIQIVYTIDLIGLEYENWLLT